MCHYHHLTLFERERASILLASGLSISAAAKSLGRSKSTISRELRRNTPSHAHYIPCRAQRRYIKRRKSCHRKKILLLNQPLFLLIKDRFLNHQWSPEQIAGRMKQEGKTGVSYSTIYRAIYARLFNRKNMPRGYLGAQHCLRHGGHTGRKSHSARAKDRYWNARPLSDRPAIANQRERIGDWEADTMVGRSHKSCLLTLVERRSKYLLCRKVHTMKVEAVTKAILDCLHGQTVFTITPDRGAEFEGWQEIEKSLPGVTFYFPPPYRPQDRGTNENTNGLLREYFPKGTDFMECTDKYIQSKVDELNHRPRKCLGYRTPYEIYHSKVLHLI